MAGLKNCTNLERIRFARSTTRPGEIPPSPGHFIPRGKPRPPTRCARTPRLSSHELLQCSLTLNYAAAQHGLMLNYAALQHSCTIKPNKGVYLVNIVIDREPFWVYGLGTGRLPRFFDIVA